MFKCPHCNREIRYPDFLKDRLHGYFNFRSKYSGLYNFDMFVFKCPYCNTFLIPDGKSRIFYVFSSLLMFFGLFFLAAKSGDFILRFWSTNINNVYGYTFLTFLTLYFILIFFWRYIWLCYIAKMELYDISKLLGRGIYKKMRLKYLNMTKRRKASGN